MRVVLNDMGYVNPVVFALYLLEEDAIYQQYKSNNNSQNITVNNDGKSGVGKSLI